MTSITASANSDNLQLLSDSRQPASSLVDPSTDTKVVKQFWLRSASDAPTGILTASAPAFKHFSFKIPKFDYEETTGLARSPWNYYVLAVAQSNSGYPLGSQVGQLQTQFIINWKDA